MYESSAPTDDRHTHERSWTTPRCTVCASDEDDWDRKNSAFDWQTFWQWIQLLTIGLVVLTSYLRQKNVITRHEWVEFRCDSQTLTLQPIIYRRLVPYQGMVTIRLYMVIHISGSMKNRMYRKQFLCETTLCCSSPGCSLNDFSKTRNSQCHVGSWQIQHKHPIRISK